MSAFTPRLRVHPAPVAALAVLLVTLPTLAADPVEVLSRLSKFEVAAVEVPADRPAQFTTQVSIDGQARDLTLTRVSVWAPDARVLVHRGGGVVEEMAPPTPNTYRGQVAGIPESLVAAAIKEDGLHATIWLDDEDVRGVVPLTGTGFHAVHREKDVVDGFICPVSAEAGAEAPLPAGAAGNAPLTQTGSTVLVADLLVECDFEYYDGNSNSVDISLNAMALVINNVNVIFEREVGITHLLSRAIVRAAEPDPYAFDFASTLLSDFRDVLDTYPPEWFDLAVLFTGKDAWFINSDGEVDEGVAGRAVVGGVCFGSSGRCFVEDFILGISDTRVTAHEMGHMWSALHCGPGEATDSSCASTADPCALMCAISGGCTASLSFGPCAVNAITAFRDQDADCLELGAAGIQWVQWRSCGIFCVENGLFAQAHNTLGEAAAAVTAGGMVMLRAGSSADSGGDETYPLVIDKAMTVRSFGGVATVGE